MLMWFTREMSLENIFYTIGIIFMTFHTLLLVAIVVLLFVIKKKMTDIYEQAEEKWEQVKDIAHNPKEALTKVGLSLVDKAMSSVENKMRAKVEKTESRS